MHMLMGVHMRRPLAHEVVESCQLARYFFLDNIDVIQRNDFIQRYPGAIAVSPFAEVDMETEAEFRLFSAIGGGLRRRRPTHHKACAGYNSGFVSFDDTSVYTGALAEVIRVDY